MFFSNFVPKNALFLRYCRLVSIQWPWNPGLQSLKVIEDDTIRSGTHDLLLKLHSNHRPISHRFRDKRRFTSKIARKSPIFLTPCVFNTPMKGSLWNWVSARGSEETRMMGLPDGRKSFKIGLAVLIQYRRVTDRQTAGQSSTQPRRRSKYALCISASRSKNPGYGPVHPQAWTSSYVYG